MSLEVQLDSILGWDAENFEALTDYEVRLFQKKGAMKAEKAQALMDEALKEGREMLTCPGFGPVTTWDQAELLNIFYEWAVLFDEKVPQHWQKGWKKILPDFISAGGNEIKLSEGLILAGVSYPNHRVAEIVVEQQPLGVNALAIVMARRDIAMRGKMVIVRIQQERFKTPWDSLARGWDLAEMIERGELSVFPVSERDW
jgi:hypothetical protein